MDEESRKTHQELWEQYMEVERRELEQRRNGQLGRALGLALPGESQQELQRIAEEDQRKAERGLVELRSGDEVWYKHIDELSREPSASQDRVGERQGGLDPGTPAPPAAPAPCKVNGIHSHLPGSKTRYQPPYVRFPAYFGPFFSSVAPEDSLCEGGHAISSEIVGNG
jgi:hypothetical protein